MTSGNRIRQRNISRYIIAYAALLLTGIVFLVFFIPLFASFFPEIFAGSRMNAFKAAANGSGKGDFFSVLSITIFTLKIAFGSTLIAVATGFPLAFFCAKRNFIFRKTLLSLSSVPLCIPILIAALGFVSVFGLSGFVNVWISKLTGGEKTRLLYSQWGIMIAQGFYNFPLVMSMVSKYWESIPCETENAARLLGSNEKEVFFKITLPYLLPSIVSSVIPVFLFCYFSFMMVLLFSSPGTTVLEVEIYQAVKTSLNLKLASKLAVSETFTAVVNLIIYSFLLGKHPVKGEAFERKEKSALCSADYQSTVSKVLEAILFVVVLLLVIFFFVFPLLGIVLSGFRARINGKDVFSINQYKTLVYSKGFWVSLGTTIKVSLCTAFVCTTVSFVYAFAVNSARKFKVLFEVVALLPMAVSSVVLGFGLTLLFHKNNVWSLIFVQSALFWPLAYRQISSAVSKIPNDVISAVYIMSGSRVEGILRVILPWVRKSLFTAFGFCFAFSAGDTTLPLVLSIPKFQTLSLYTYRLSGSYRFNTACASGTVLAVLCFIVFALSEKIGGDK